ncbi:MAG: adenylate cyclase [Hyphomicrobiales bacterium]|nr:adenylate cyclase [Hyphomicrobiales bacterium]
MAAPRRLTVMVSLDVAGFTRLVQDNERAALTEVAAIRRDLIDPTLQPRGGNVFKTMGDGALIEFPNVEDAVSWTIEFQEAMADRNLRRPEKPILVRAGIALADVYIDGDDRSGAAIAYLVRLQEAAPPGGIAMTHSVRWQLGKGLVTRFTRVTTMLKGMDEPWEIWVWPSSATGAAPDPVKLHGDREDRHPGLPEKPSLAVLPFQNLSGEPDQEYFADGVVEEIITALSRVRSFFVIARNSSFTYKGKSADVKQVGRELGVRYVLEGSVRRAAGKVRVTCQLIEAQTNTHIWADRFEGELKDIFDLQDRVTENVVGAIVPNLQLAEIERAQQKPTQNLLAYDFYLRALPPLYTLARSGLDESRDLLLKALEAEPSYALAKAMVSRCYVFKRAQLWGTEDERLEGIRLAREALGAHKDDPTTLAVAGHALGYLAKEFEVARNAIERSLFLNPSSIIGLTAQGMLHNWTNRPDAALEAFGRALRISPLDPGKLWTLFGLARAYTRLGHYEEGLETGLAAVRERPESIHSYLPVIQCLVRLGRMAEARRFAADLMQIDSEFTVTKFDEVAVSQGEEWRKRAIEDFRLAGLPE